MNEKIYKAMVDHSPLGLAYYQKIYGAKGLSNDYKFIDANPAFEEMIGIKLEKLVGRRVSDIFEATSKGKLKWLDFYQRTKSDHQNREYDMYIDFLDKYYRIKTYFLEDDYLMVYFNDVSLEMDERRKYELLSDNINTQIWYLKDPLTYGSANKTHADFLGLKKEALEFKNIHDIFSKEEAAICIQVNEEIFQERQTTHNEEWLVNAAGERRLLKVSKEPKFNAKGEIEFVICSAEDITQEKQLEDEKKKPGMDPLFNDRLYP